MAPDSPAIADFGKTELRHLLESSPGIQGKGPGRIQTALFPEFPQELKQLSIVRHAGEFFRPRHDSRCARGASPIGLPRCAFPFYWGAFTLYGDWR